MPLQPPSLQTPCRGAAIRILCPISTDTLFRTGAKPGAEPFLTTVNADTRSAGTKPAPGKRRTPRRRSWKLCNRSDSGVTSYLAS